MQSCILFMNLKKLNRLAHMRLKRGRDQTHEVNEYFKIIKERRKNNTKKCTAIRSSLCYEDQIFLLTTPVRSSFDCLSNSLVLGSFQFYLFPCFAVKHIMTFFLPGEAESGCAAPSATEPAV